MNHTITPPAIAAPAANYAHAVLVEAPERTLYTSGVVPIAPDDTVPSPLGDQARVIWENIAAMLVEVDMTPSDVVSVTTYVVVGEELGSIMAARDAFLDGRLVASTLVTVPELAQPAWRVEIAVVAAR